MITVVLPVVLSVWLPPPWAVLPAAGVRVTLIDVALVLAPRLTV